MPKFKCFRCKGQYETADERDNCLKEHSSKANISTSPMRSFSSVLDTPPSISLTLEEDREISKLLISNDSSVNAPSSVDIEAVPFSNDHIKFCDEVQILICVTCGVGYSSGQAALRHLTDQHQRLKPPDRTSLLNFGRLAPCKPPVNASGLASPVQGLKITGNGVGCTQCDYCCLSVATLKHHQSVARHTGVRTGLSLQTLCNGQNKNFFAVNIAEDSGNRHVSHTLPEQVAFDFRTFFSQYATETYASNLESISVASWNTKIPLLQRQTSLHYCLRPDSSDVWYGPSVLDLLKSYFHLIQTTITRASRLSRRLLVSSDLMQDDDSTGSMVSRRGMQALQNESSVYSYCQYALLLLAYVVRLFDNSLLDNNELRLAVEDFLKTKTLSTLHSVFLCIVKEEFPERTSEENLLIFKFMVFSNCNKEGVIKKASEITPKLSMLLYLFRGVMLLDYYHFEGIDSIESAIRYLRDGVNTPFNLVSQEKGLLYWIASQEDLLTRIAWIDARTWRALSIDGITLSIGELKEVSRKLLGICESLVSELTFGQRIDIPNMAELNDKLVSSEIGYNFVSANSVKFADLGSTLMSIVCSTKHLFVDDEWRLGMCRDWLKKFDAFIMYLLAVSHITGGMPARGTELSALTWKNAAYISRSVYIYGGRVMLLQRYHKGFHRSGLANIARFLPDSVGKLMVIYLGLLRPFASYLKAQVLGEDYDEEYLWTNDGKAMSSEYCRDGFSSTFAEISGKSISFSGYRQAIQAFAEKLLCLHEDRTDLDDINYQFGHATKTGSRYYGRSEFDLSHIRRDVLSSLLAKSVQWQSLLGLAEYQSPDTRLTLPTTTSFKETGDVSVNVSQVNLIMPSSTITWDKPQIPVQKQTVDNYTSVYLDAFAKLKAFGIKEFRSPEQASVVVEVMRNECDVLAVMPTGSGKSMSIWIPVLVDCGKPLVSTTILIVPLIGLQNQFIALAQKYCIPSALWVSDMQPSHSPALVVVMAENAVKEQFRSFICTLANLGRLSRVIIDECHLVCTSNNFRSCFEKLHTIRVAPCPFVLLSATVPPLLENELKIKFCSAFKVIRMSTQNWNAYYEVVEIEESSLFQKCSRLIKQHVSQGPVAVFVASKNAGKTLTQELTALGWSAALYSSELSDVERSDIVRALGHGLKVVIATSAFSVGIDIEAMSTVIHSNCAWSLIDYVQESGRAGRMGRKSHCYLLKTSSLTSSDMSMQQYMDNNTECRRAVMSHHMDGKAQYCFGMPDCTFCDICLSLERTRNSKRSIAVGEVNSTKKVRFQSDAHVPVDTIESLRMMVSEAKTKAMMSVPMPIPQTISAACVSDAFKKDTSNLMNTIELLRLVRTKGCIVCLFRSSGNTPDQTHSISFHNECIRCMGDHKSASCSRGSLKNLCFVCAMPGNLGTQWRHGDNYGKSCQQGLSDLLVPLAFLVWRDCPKRDIMFKELGTGLICKAEEDYVEYWQWLNKRSDMNLPNFVRVLKFCVSKKWI